MVNEELFNAKLTQLNDERAELNREKDAIIDNHKAEIDAKIEEETKKFVDENRERFIYEVAGEELKIVDEKLHINKEIFDTLEKLVIVTEEPKITLDEVLPVVDTNLN